ncbi:membrane-bound lytic murein transglycosylase F [Microbulbifer donghaiensis]|uniref:Membrane-bound lytic murein transglycosylase F n=1 Tax=Microbulbifer donghaiensis TaxID=494016 RepID=A0A1M5D1U2_9GAMM|nr:transporter substrate-binding domain-containing protein [Microbulbifer donghaiensis]SHF60966.1 membrane-bound lytic murein transglycosylase F [Microbulbifer donghaiensis]
MQIPLTRLLWPLLAIVLLVTACGDRGSPEKPAPSPEPGATSQSQERPGTADSREEQKRDTRDKPLDWAPEIQGEYPIDLYNNYTETGDLKAIRKHGKLRILVDTSTTESLHRAATRQDIEIELAKRLARTLKLEPIVLYVDDFDELIPQLLAGKGDLIANHLTRTPEREQQLSFSEPHDVTDLVLVSAADADKVTASSDLSGKTLIVTEGTTYESKARELVEDYPGLKLEVVDRNYVDLAVDVALGRHDFTIIDEVILDQVLQFRQDLQKNVIYKKDQFLSWAVRPDSPELLKTINDKIRHVQLTRTTKRMTEDLPNIQARDLLRIATRNNVGSYFMWKGRVLGYEFELAEAFAKDIGVRLEVIVAPEHDDFIEMLQEGKADIAANLLAITFRRQQQGMKFSEPTHRARVVVVSRKGVDIPDLQALAGHTVYLRESSSHYDLLQEIQKKVPELKIELVPETMDIQHIIDKIGEGEYDLTFADDLTVDMELTWRTDIQIALDLDDEHEHAWMMRKSNPELVAAVNKFLRKPKTKKLLAQLYTKYFDSPKHVRPEIRKLSVNGNISPYDELVQKYAEEYDFDWRLVVAQMFQESSFNPKAKSWVGARGLMQVMPATGKQVGEANLFDPETSVRAGLKYLDWLHQKFVNRERISPENEMWFTLAAYNAGLGHVYDAKDLAEEMGWDRKVWFGNVEKAMLLLSERKYYKKARYGYARGREPYDYVRKIEARFRTYVALLDAYRRQQQAASISCPAMPPWAVKYLEACISEVFVADRTSLVPDRFN